MTDSDTPSGKVWAARFSGPTGETMERFNASIRFDNVLYRVDIQGSRAQAKALARIGVLAPDELDGVLRGLDQVEVEIQAGELALSDEMEDSGYSLLARYRVPGRGLSRTRMVSRPVPSMPTRFSVSRPPPGRVSLTK